MESYTDNASTVHLSREHEHMLLHDSGIDPGVAAERGYQTVRSRAKLSDFKRYQRKLGLLIPVRSPSGATGRRLRPDRPRRGKGGKPVKYEQPAETPNMLDVHPRNSAALGDVGVDLWVVEGEKKADALTSRGLCAVALFGVWGWCVTGTKGQELLPCWDHIELSGRRVRIVFDADIMEKENVQLALERLVAALEGRGAEVLVVYLPGPEKGVDDYLVAGGTVNELKMLARKFEPSDFGQIRLSRDKELSVKVEQAWSRWWKENWSRIVGTGERPHWMRGQSCRDAIKVAIDVMARTGEVVVDGIRFTLSVRAWALLAATSKTTMLKVIAHLEAEDWIRRDNGDKAEDAAGSYVLILERSSLDHDGKKLGLEGKATQGLQAYGPGGQGLSAPRLRWSAPTFDRDGDRVVRDYVRRLGKRRGAIIDVLEKEGPIDINEVAEALRVSRARNLRRNLPMLEEAGIINVSGDIISLNPDWLEALETERKLKGEIRNDQGEEGAQERDRRRYRRQSKGYRDWLALSPEERKALKNQRARARADGFIGDLRPAKEPEVQLEPPPISPLAVAIRDYLDRSPQDACQPPGWIGSTLWAFDRCEGKPTPDDVQSAIDELGGEAYLQGKLSRARDAA
jgi:predicted transcriptional regulator